MNQYKKRYTILRRNLETGVIEGYLRKPYYQWSEQYLYFTEVSSKHHVDTDSHLRREMYWFKRQEKDELGKLKHEYFVVRLNSKKCPITTTTDIGGNRNPYKTMLRFSVK